MASTTERTPGARRRAVFASLLSLAFLLSAALADAARQEIGYVVSLRGEWYLNGQQRLRPGGTVTAGGVISVRDRRGGEYIEVADRNGEILIVRNCDLSDCKQPFRLPTPRTSLTRRVFVAAMLLLAGAPPQFAVAISRGGELRESVVKIAGEQVELSSVLAGKSKGTYLISFEPRGALAPSAKSPAGPVTVEWDPNRLAPVVVKGLTPGLYVAQPLGAQDRGLLEPGTEAFVLFVRPDRFDQIFCEFREAVALTESWGDSVRRNSKRQFLRASLASLATGAR